MRPEGTIPAVFGRVLLAEKKKLASQPLNRFESQRMSTASTAVRRKPWEDRSVVVSLVLAILVPGLGHLYQGRILKGLIYLVGILGLFLWGVKMGEGVVVYNLPERGMPRRLTLHYAAQLGAGLISYPALWQQSRVSKGNRPVTQLEQPLSAKFSGKLTTNGDEKIIGTLEGKVQLAPESSDYGPETMGTFRGTLNGEPIELPLMGRFELDRPIAAGFRRQLKCGVANERKSGTSHDRMIEGSIPRSFMNGYGIAPDLDQLQEVTGRLGKLHELALVFTWIAGLLNILAIWDCVQGPAYGFGDEHLATSPEEKPTTSPTPVDYSPSTTAKPA